MTMGNIVSVDYVPINRNKTIYMSANKSAKNTLLIPTLFTEERLPFLKISEENIKIYKPEKHQFFDLKQNKKVLDHMTMLKYLIKLMMNFASLWDPVEIRIETVDSPPKLISSPFSKQIETYKVRVLKSFQLFLHFL